MTAENLKNFIKAQMPEFSGCVQLGGVNGNADKFLGVYPARDPGAMRIAIGGPACTTYDTFQARLLLRWGKSQPEAEKMARKLWGLFYGLSGADMDGAAVSFTDPGACPVPVGRSLDGAFEYVINLKIIHRKEKSYG